MYQNKPEWFSAPRDVLPGSTITPGRLIVDPRAPEGPPYLDKALSIPDADLRVTNYPYKSERQDEKGGSLGLFGSFMSAFGLGGDLSGNIKSGTALDIEVDRLQTVMFDPSVEYLEESLNSPKNLAYLRDQRFKRSLYLVTGVKTAYGARLTRSRSEQRGAKAKLGISPNVPGLEIGPTASYTQTGKVTETVQGPTDFVFAYRLNKLHYSRTRSKYVQQKFTTGALYSDEVDLKDEVEAIKAADSEGEEFAEVVGGLEDDDAGRAEFKIPGEAVFDEEDGEPCIILLPEASTPAWAVGGG
ncbi:uncharacterized protein A1O9_00706 [Exophiala aquamarina CBS 119918]|uniref:Uncharacterized protein n=1 Tax=Exophiala aquamarina CBS 119918 TaxID=1182545 RepID=A0A072PTT0_9EURO|nr:uncharacterized protein A1O9_00706 [Exophiala aquamarina CBS 119918]KEF62733.1 hypothetical protein A1O9_00706 [Exophiala aquamarina CBS 119918]